MFFGFPLWVETLNSSNNWTNEFAVRQICVALFGLWRSSGESFYLFYKCCWSFDVFSLFYLLFIFYYKSLLSFWGNHTTIETDLSPRRNVIYCIYISSEAGYLYWSSWMRVCFDLASAELETNIYKYSLSHNTLLFTFIFSSVSFPVL